MSFTFRKRGVMPEIFEGKKEKGMLEGKKKDLERNRLQGKKKRYHTKIVRKEGKGNISPNKRGGNKIFGARRGERAAWRESKAEESMARKKERWGKIS